MKIPFFAFRVGVSLAAGVLVGLLATAVFDSAGYSGADYAFLFLVPALSAAWLVFSAQPPWWERMEQAFVKFRRGYSFAVYLASFLLASVFAFFAAGFFSGVVRSAFHLVLFSGGLTLAGSATGYFLVRRALRSLREGFLSKPWTLALSLSLPVFLAALAFAALQFPAILRQDELVLSAERRGWFAFSVLTAGLAGVFALPRLDSSLFAEFRKTGLFRFFKENLPGLYAGGVFFLMNLVVGRALNRPALTVNSVLFESDAGPWLSILGAPLEEPINRAVHPLALILLRPLARFFALFTGGEWSLAPILAAAAASGLCVFMAWLFVKRAAAEEGYAFLFAVMLGSTAAHLTFGSLTDTYIFGAASLIFFLLLVQAKESRFSVLLPAGLVVFGITVTNVAQGVIALFFNGFGFKRLLRYALTLAAFAVLLTALTAALYPNRQTLFFIPGDIAFEGNFIKPVYSSPAEYLRQKLNVVGRSILLYGVVAPSPLEVVADKPPYPTIDLKTYDVRTGKLASYDGLGNLPLALWLILLGGAFLQFAKGWRASPHFLLSLSLLGVLVFNFVLHMNYGTELFLYAPFWTYALILFVALAFAVQAGKPWFESLTTVFLLVLIVNNFQFIFAILRALAPFYASVSP